MVNRKLDKKIIFVLIISVLFMAGVGVAYTQSIPNSGHGADSVLVSVDGYSMTLQEAIDYGVLVDGASATCSWTTQVSNQGHNAKDIYVSVNGNKKSLQQAISSSLCGSGAYSYSSGISFGHSASEILVSVGGSEMSLQDAINAGKFCVVCTSHNYKSCYNNDVYWYDSCGVREGKLIECGTSAYSGSNYCYNNDVYRNYITKGCSGNSCTLSTSKIKQEECGAKGCSGGSCVTCTTKTWSSSFKYYGWTCENNYRGVECAGDYNLHLDSYPVEAKAISPTFLDFTANMQHTITFKIKGNGDDIGCSRAEGRVEIYNNAGQLIFKSGTFRPTSCNYYNLKNYSFTGVPSRIKLVGIWAGLEGRQWNGHISFDDVSISNC
ncbi:hypothetical protein KAT36_04625 [Candidatus Pacearchaeota archaeon]|nr:hypothetical protein [Candidatus Pacearchaeota archaeon]